MIGEVMTMRTLNFLMRFRWWSMSLASSGFSGRLGTEAEIGGSSSSNGDLVATGSESSSLLNLDIMSILKREREEN